MRDTLIRYLKFLALSLLVFGPALMGKILFWDDTTHIELNPDLQAGRWTNFWYYPFYRLYIPVFYTVWTWLYAISSEPWIFHLFNLMVHALCGVFVYALLEKAVPKASRSALTLATLAFLLHPLQSETAAWISGGRDLLSAAFGLAAALLLFRDSWRAMGLACVLFVLGLLSKATLAPLPVALLLIPAVREKWDRKRAVTLGFWLVAAVIVIGINKAVQQDDTDQMLAHTALFLRPVIAMDALGFYFQKLLVPYPIASDYGRIPSLVLEKHLYIVPILVLSLVTGFAIWLYRRRFPLFGGGFFILTLGPVLGLVPFMAQAQSTVADRYVYVGMAGISMMVAAFLTGRAQWQKAFAALLMVWAILNFMRAQDYKDNDTFFTKMLQYNPDSFVGHTTIGVVVFTAGRMDLAEKHFREAMRIQPLNISPLGNQAQLLWNERRYEEIIRDIEPLFRRPEMKDSNRNNVTSMARCIRLIARAYVVLGRIQEANSRYCESFEYNAADPETMSEYAQYLHHARAKGVSVVPCSNPPPPSSKNQ